MEISNRHNDLKILFDRRISRSVLKSSSLLANKSDSPLTTTVIIIIIIIIIFITITVYYFI